MRRVGVAVRYALPPVPLMPLPPKPPLTPLLALLLAPSLELLDEIPALPRVPADVLPALRLAVLELLLGAAATLLPADDVLTSLATDAALAVTAPAWSEAAEADLFVAATPPPVPEVWPETDVRDAASAVLREAAWAELTVDGADELGCGGGE